MLKYRKKILRSGALNICVLAVLALQLLQRVVVDVVDELLEAQQGEDLELEKKSCSSMISEQEGSIRRRHGNPLE